MVMRFRKKVRKRRGSRTHGYGRISQHRKSGQRGGTGAAGSSKHKKIYILLRNPNYFGKHGFKRPAVVVKRDVTINIRQLDDSIDTFISQGVARKINGKIEIDLNALGYTKLLGTGKPTRPFIVKVKSCTPLAQEKIEAAGGEIIKIE
ncbi:MAG: uL15 family ribosomal protein [Candidatus Odinarchaeia archaeon]